MSQDSIVRLQAGLSAFHTFLKVFRPNGGPQPHLAALINGATWRSELEIDDKSLRMMIPGFDALGRYSLHVWNWAAALRASQPGMRLLRSAGTRPTEVSLAETIDAFNPRRRFDDDFEIFRDWNRSASMRRGERSGAFLEMMREAHEAFVKSQFVAGEKHVGELEVE